jgi:hypothetical protein
MHISHDSISSAPASRAAGDGWLVGLGVEEAEVAMDALTQERSAAGTRGYWCRGGRGRWRRGGDHDSGDGVVNDESGIVPVDGGGATRGRKEARQTSVAGAGLG